ncbi:MAG: efflux RND transporter periplasmic adaptor subunit [Cyanobacteriota bacterium]|nr:efflux RND transporter periplasmic adaptor subunit [Cyanobacteriota bacterium]
MPELNLSDFPTKGDSPEPVAVEDVPASEESPEPPESSEFQESKSEKGKSWGAIASAVILALIAGFFGGEWLRANNTDAEAPAAEQPTERRSTSVKVAPVEVSQVRDTSEFVGTLEAKRSVTVRPEIEGRVVRVFVEAGDFVREGEPIARLESEGLQADLRRGEANLSRARSQLAQLQAGPRQEEIAAARARLNQERANLEQLQAGPRREEVTSARARVDRAKAGLEELQAGSRVEEIAEAKARLDEAEARLADTQSGSLLEEIAQAKAQIEVRQAELELAKDRVRRNGELREEGAIAELDFQEYVKEEQAAVARVNEAKGRVEQLEQNRRSEITRLEATVEQQRQVLRRLENGTRPEEIAQGKAEVAEAESNLSQLLNGTRPEEIARAEAEVAEAESNLSQLVNGTRPEEIARAEAEVAAAQAEVESDRAELNNAEVLAPFSGVIGDVPLKVGDFASKGDTITTLTENQELELRLPIPLEKQAELELGLPVEIADADGKSLGSGRITFISPTVSDAQTVLAKTTIDNRQRSLQNGQFVRALVVWDERRSVVVPMTAVNFLGDERFVFVTSGDPEEQVAKQVPVKLGLIKGDRAEVIQGLQGGEKLIVSGIQRLRDGADIKVMNNAGS